MANITKEALLESTVASLYGLVETKAVSVQEWVLTQNQILEQGPSDSLHKDSYVLKNALALFNATDKIEKAKCSINLCAALWFTHLHVRKLLMQSGDLSNDLQGQIDILQQRTDDMTKVVSAKNSQLDTSVAELDKLRAIANERAAEIVKIQAELKDVDLQLVAEKGKAGDLAEQVTGLQKQVDGLEIVEARQINKLSRLQDEVQNLTENKDTLLTKLANLQDVSAADQNKMNTLCAELKQANQTIAEMTQERGLFEKGIDNWRIKYDGLKQEYELYKNEVAGCQIECRKNAECKERAEQQLQVLNEELTKCKGREGFLISENENLQSQLTQLPALRLQIQELRKKSDLPVSVPPSGESTHIPFSTGQIQRPSVLLPDRFAAGRGYDIFSATAPSSGALQHSNPFSYEQGKATQSYFGQSTTQGTIDNTTTTYSLWNTRTSASVTAEGSASAYAPKRNVGAVEINLDGLLPDYVEEKNARRNAIWATDLERLQVTGTAVGDPMQAGTISAPPIGGAIGRNSVLVPSPAIGTSGQYNYVPRQDFSGDECEVPRSSRKKNRNRDAPMDEFDEIRQVQKLLTPYARESKVSIHTHLNLYEKIMRSFGIDSTFKQKRFLSWTFAGSEQNFFLSLDLNDYETWADLKKVVLRQYSSHRNTQEALKFALNLTCFPNQNPRDFLHVLKNAFSQVDQDFDVESPTFKNTFFHGLPPVIKVQLALTYDGSQNLKWILTQAQRIFEVSKASEQKDSKQKSPVVKSVGEVGKADQLGLEAGAKQGTDNQPKGKDFNQKNEKGGDSGGKAGSNSPNGSQQNIGFKVSKNYKGNRPIQNYVYRPNNRSRNNSGNSGNDRPSQNRESAESGQGESRNWAPRNEQREWVRQVEQSNWGRQRDRSPPTGREREQQPTRLETIENQVKYLADTLSGFLRAQAQSESNTRRNQAQEGSGNASE